MEPLLNFLGTQVLCVSCFLKVVFVYVCMSFLILLSYCLCILFISRLQHVHQWSHCTLVILSSILSLYCTVRFFFLVNYAFVSKSCFTNSPSVKGSFPPLVLTGLVLFSTFFSLIQFPLHPPKSRVTNVAFSVSDFLSNSWSGFQQALLPQGLGDTTPVAVSQFSTAFDRLVVFKPSLSHCSYC